MNAFIEEQSKFLPRIRLIRRSEEQFQITQF